ncbi:MAG: phosphorylase family protein [Acidimicrobiales bacterium]
MADADAGAAIPNHGLAAHLGILACVYKTHTAAEYRQFFGLDEEYEVAGLLAYGVWDLSAELRQVPHLREALDRAGVEYQLERLGNPQIGHAYELTVFERIYWYVPVMGTAVMAQYLHLACLFGSARNVLLGTVGGLAPGMRNADFVVPTAVKGNDSAWMYDRANESALHYPDDGLLGVLQSKLPPEPKSWQGPTTTCEMMLAETKEDVDEWSQAGFLGVEMEAALFFAVSRHFAVPSVALLYVGDNLIENETVLSSSHAASKGQRQAARAVQYRIGLELLFRHAENEI